MPLIVPPYAAQIATNLFERYKTKNPQSRRRNAGLVEATELQKKTVVRKPPSKSLFKLMKDIDNIFHTLKYAPKCAPRLMKHPLKAHPKVELSNKS
jgi:hypothetical protein